MTDTVADQPTVRMPARAIELAAMVEARLATVWSDLVVGHLQPPVGPSGLREAMDYSLLAPGKRIRPVLALAVAETCGGNVEAALDAAVAIELIHAYSLVHDDLPAMDDDDLRRGRPTNHRAFDEATAILVGDALQTRAFGLVAGSRTLPAELRIRIVGRLAHSAGWAGMVGGQFLDVANEGHFEDRAALHAMHAMKTGALLAASAEIGAIAAGCDPHTVTTAEAFGAQVGSLFQVVDDLLDVVGDVRITGKPVGSDRGHDKVTAVTVYGVEGLRSHGSDLLRNCVETAHALPGAGGILPDIARFVHGRDR